MGAPLGKSMRVTAAGAEPTRNDLGGYSIMQGESKEAVAEALKGHPHFSMPGGFIILPSPEPRATVVSTARWRFAVV